ncbi:MAG: hypothetical protein ACI9JL_004285 [Paracoccaceae bacterium]
MDREIKCAGIWYAGNDFYSEMEAVALSRLLEDRGVRVSLESGEKKSKVDFTHFYENPDFDLIWVAGHGIYDHWEPMSLAVLAGNDGEVSIDEMLACEFEGEGRRLLVLNICDGGVAAVLGGIQKLGLAPMLASHKQAVVSHHWPVEPRAAAAFGLMFARSLVSQERSFFQSFECALDGLRRPWEEIVDEISEVVESDVVDRFRNVNIDTNNLFHWGSPCFFQ